MRFLPPYSRRDLAMIRQAIRNQWNVPDATKAVVAASVARLAIDDAAPPSLQRAAKETLEAIRGAGW